MPLPQSKWQSLADSFEKRWEVSNCVGVVATKHLQKKSIVLTLLIRADLGISLCNIQQTLGTLSCAAAVDGVFAEYEFRYPAPRPLRKTGPAVPYVFVGGPKLKRSPRLVVSSDAGPYTADEVARALRPAELAMKLLTTRFKYLELPLPGPNTFDMMGGLLAITLLHNVLLAKSPEYSVGHGEQA